MVKNNTTIIAPATPLVYSGVAIIRVSGLLVKKIIKTWLNKSEVQPKTLYLSDFVINNKIIDQGLWCFFSGPASYTGEDVLEIYPHGSPIVVKSIIDNLIILFDLKYASPGEFTFRAFINNKIDLTQAEAVNELIHASSLDAAEAASSTLKGCVAKKCYDLEKKLIDFRSIAEFCLDFADDEMQNEKINEKLYSDMSSWIIDAKDFIAEANMSLTLFNLPEITILGLPNAGKSSLINFLSKKKISIVSDKEGTTRDIITNDVFFDGIKIKLQDTAGIRETSCSIEKEGIFLIKDKLLDTKLILWVIDACDDIFSVAHNAINWLGDFLNEKQLVFVLNKLDLVCNKSDLPKSMLGFDVVFCSCFDDHYLSELKNVIINKVTNKNTQAKFFANQRQIDALNKSIAFVENAMKHDVLDEFFAQELIFAHKALMSVLGVFNNEDLLGVVFSSFCIGK